MNASRPVNDAVLNIRVPESLRVLLDALAVRQCVTTSHIIRSLLETHPTVVWAAERVYNVGMEQPSEREGE